MPTEQTDWAPATLTASLEASQREALRLFVRDQIGADYIINPDALVGSSTLIATDRGRQTAMGQPRLTPDIAYRLEGATRQGVFQCRLVNLEDETADPFWLEAQAPCGPA
jgi:hypothetical protein